MENIIKQIIPADNWYAIMKFGEEIRYSKVVCWSLMHTNDEGIEYDRIVGMGDFSNCIAYWYDDEENFEGYRFSLTDIETYKN